MRDISYNDCTTQSAPSAELLTVSVLHLSLFQESAAEKSEQRLEGWTEVFQGNDWRQLKELSGVVSMIPISSTDQNYDLSHW